MANTSWPVACVLTQLPLYSEASVRIPSPSLICTYESGSDWELLSRGFTLYERGLFKKKGKATSLILSKAKEMWQILASRQTSPVSATACLCPQSSTVTYCEHLLNDPPWLLHSRHVEFTQGWHTCKYFDHLLVKTTCDWRLTQEYPPGENILPLNKVHLFSKAKLSLPVRIFTYAVS